MAGIPLVRLRERPGALAARARLRRRGQRTRQEHEEVGADHEEDYRSQDVLWGGQAAAGFRRGPPTGRVALDARAKQVLDNDFASDWDRAPVDSARVFSLQVGAQCVLSGVSCGFRLAVVVAAEITLNVLLWKRTFFWVAIPTLLLTPFCYEKSWCEHARMGLASIWHLLRHICISGVRGMVPRKADVERHLNLRC